MMLPLILFSLCGCSLLVAYTLLRYSQVVHYIRIPGSLLDDWSREREDVIVIDLRGPKGCVSGALHVSPREIFDLFRWIPPEAKLVLCGQMEIDASRSDIDSALSSVGINIVYVPSEEARAAQSPISPDLANVKQS